MPVFYPTCRYRWVPPTNEIAASWLERTNFRGYPYNARTKTHPREAPMAALRTTLELAARNILLLLRPIPKRNDGTMERAESEGFSGRAKTDHHGLENRDQAIGDGENTAGGRSSLFHRFSERTRIPPFPFLFHHRQPWLTLLSTMRSSSTMTRRRWVD